MYYVILKGGESLHFHNRLEVTNKVADECQAVFQALKIRRKHRYITFMLGNEEIVGISYILLTWVIFNNFLYLLCPIFMNERSG